METRSVNQGSLLALGWDSVEHLQDLIDEQSVTYAAASFFHSLDSFTYSRSGRLGCHCETSDPRQDVGDCVQRDYGFRHRNLLDVRRHVLVGVLVGKSNTHAKPDEQTIEPVHR